MRVLHLCFKRTVALVCAVAFACMACFGCAGGESAAENPLVLAGVSSPKAGCISAEASPVEGAAGYQFAVSSSALFPDTDATQTVETGSDEPAHSFSKLEQGATYYVRARAFKDSGEQRAWGGWSSIEHVTVTAAKYTVHFDPNGADGAMDDYRATYQVEFKLPKADFEAPDTYYQTCRFAGWSKTADGDVAFKDKETVKNLTKKESVTLYAVWDATPVSPAAALGAASVALAGGDQLMGPNRKAKNAGKVPPPNTKGKSDWTVYNKVYPSFPNNHHLAHKGHKRKGLHAHCSQTVYMAVRWSGVDDSFSDGNTLEQYKYMNKSSKWKDVGTWNRNTGKGSAKPQPGDVLVSLKCRTKNKTGHIFMYVGDELAQARVEGTKAVLMESLENRAWAFLNTGKNNYASHKYIVFRSTRSEVPEDSKYGSIEAQEKIKYYKAAEDALKSGDD